MHILLTGGGTAGHAIPNIAIAAAIRDFDPKAKISYIGSYGGQEKALCVDAKIPFESIMTGKWRRYFSLRNFVDLFRIPLGTLQAFFKMVKSRPHAVFSKGGFVGLPVVWAAFLLGIPVFIHESDVIPGLATRLSAPFARRIFLGHSQTEEMMKRYHKKIEFVGNPIRLDLMEGRAERAMKFTGFSGEKPVLLVMGGSSGAQEINHRIEREKEALTEQYSILLLTGEGKGESLKHKDFCSLPFLGKELKDVFALVSLCISRAGAGALVELKALQIPTLLFPLGTNASRGDQLANAEALCEEESIFRMGEKDKPLLSQLLLLPERTKKREENGATQKIALTLLSALK